MYIILHLLIFISVYLPTGLCIILKVLKKRIC